MVVVVVEVAVAGEGLRRGLFRKRELRRVGVKL